MKTQVVFKSNLFPPYEGEEEEINSGLWGKRLAEFLQGELAKHDFDVLKLIPEDWGWMIELKDNDFPLWVGCGHQQGDGDEFICFIEPCMPLIRKMFKKIDTTSRIKELSEALEDILASTPEIHDIRWMESMG